jgi:hypothetical protein
VAELYSDSFTFEGTELSEEALDRLRGIAERAGFNAHFAFTVLSDQLVARTTPVPYNPVAIYRNYSAGDPGQQLLRSLLTEEQKEQLDRDACFLVTGSRNGLYKIRCTSTAFNVTRLHRRTKEKLYDLCAGPDGVTYNDFWLAQKLMIEANEEAFLRIANRG